MTALPPHAPAPWSRCNRTGEDAETPVPWDGQDGRGNHGWPRPLRPLLRERRVLKRGEHLFHAGDPLRSLYAVRAGSFKVYALTDAGAEIVFGFYLPGDLIGLEAVNRRSHGFAAVALETGCVAPVPFTRLQARCHRSPDLQTVLNDFYSAEIGRECALLLLKSKKDAGNRLASFLLEMAERYAERGYSPNEFNLSMSRNEIGNYLGLTPETVSRAFSRFQDGKLLQVDKRHVRILDKTRLLALASQAV